MRKYLLPSIFLLVCMASGFGIFYYSYYQERGLLFTFIGAFLGLALGIIILLLEEKIRKIPFLQVLGGSLGLILGLGLAKLLSSFFEIFTQGVWQVFLYLMSMLGLGYLGMVLGGEKIKEIKIGDFIEKFSEKLAKIYTPISTVSKKLSSKKEISKIIDTSAIIDGRIIEICKTGWLEGIIIIPKIVLDEIQYLADSSDPSKRSKGRRALELLNELKNVEKVELRIVDQNYKELSNTDEKLIKICKELNAKLITTDYNLNKLSQLQGVEVLNINELFLALRPPIFPGESLKIQIIKEGKERNQGVGYLEDGTMVVVEGGKSFVGKELEVVVSHLLHSPTGRIVFANIKEFKREGVL
ncbi:MAG: PIN domain-containing protein [Thermodesulfobacteriaceae bacterium]|nr:PIN domain-containing protein [Thermodesulfobacteriaceae bacterium]MCX8041492.1 PIN domain-containing protein [Thermodesulfobacteriaceae bacterium]MDW8135962.1 PIN domain-containing protein [Thermodesulfobacterium sp.]